MRSTTFSIGLALLISGSGLLPVLADSSLPSPPPTEVATSQVDPPFLQDPELQVAPIKIPKPEVLRSIRGEASWYGPGFYGNRTANGEVFRRGSLTAAHRTLPFGTKVVVTNLDNGRKTTVRINDRGPFHGARVIDLAHGAASELGLTSSGVASVKLEVLR